MAGSGPVAGNGGAIAVAGAAATGGAGTVNEGGGVASAGASGSTQQVDGGAGAAEDGGVAPCNQPVADLYSMSIAGTWNFTPAGAAATKIQVPGGGWIKQGFNPTSATYQTTVAIPDSGAPQTTLIEFGAVNFQSTLSIDGKEVGTNTTSFTPSVFDVTKFVTPGKSHSVSVLVKGKNALKSGTRFTVPAAGAWQQYMPQGIFRSAMVRVYPDVYISDAFVRPSVTNDTLSYDVWVTNTGSANQQLTLSGTLGSWNCDTVSYPSIAATPVTVAAGATKKVTIGPIKWGLGPSSYWWPNIPYQATYKAKLHNLLVSISNGAKTVHSRVVRFGFREFTIGRPDAQHAYFYLNGVRADLRGDSLQGEDYDSIDTGGGKGDAYDLFPGFLPPSASNAGFPQAVLNYEHLNYNIVRIHQELAAPYMLDVADELGLMLIDETAIRGSENDEDFSVGHDNMVNHAVALVLRDRNHPSVVRWSQSNEADHATTNSVQFARDLYTAMNAADGTRPISADLAGNGKVYDALTYDNYTTIGHYRGGIGKYTDQVNSRPDRPFGRGNTSGMPTKRGKA